MAAKTVLIADDDQALVQALAIRCRQLGLEVQTVPDGMEAYNVITAKPPDLLILDVQMPAVNGLYLCDELAQDTNVPPIPTIILTGMSDQSTTRKCERLGAHYVWKGLDTWDQLKPVICQLLDLGTAPEQQPASPAAAKEAETPEPTAQPALPTILIIDDDPEVSRAIKIRLRPHGVEVLRAFNGMQGYWMALRDRPAAIVSDYTMPDGYGNWLLGRLKEHTATKDIPVIILTGRTIAGKPDYPLERTLLNLGAAAYLTKPLDFDVLLAELGRHIDMHSPETQAAPSQH
ncbi:MAG: response regulator [Phycisphaerae bacterium]|jgi:DNA-binding response OmpR family regulator